MYWLTIKDGELWHLVEIIDEEEHIRAEVHLRHYSGGISHFVVNGHSKQYDTETEAMQAAEEFFVVGFI